MLLEPPLALRLPNEDRDSDCEMLDVKLESALKVRDLPIRPFPGAWTLAIGMFSSRPRGMTGVTEYAVS